MQLLKSLHTEGRTIVLATANGGAALRQIQSGDLR